MTAWLMRRFFATARLCEPHSWGLKAPKTLLGLSRINARLPV